MKLQLIMLENPIIVSDEEIKERDEAIDLGEDFGLQNQTFIVDKVTLKYANEECKKVIAESHQIDWNGLEEVFGYVDVDKLALIEGLKFYSYTDNNNELALGGFIRGFKKAQELNDKKFSLEDMEKSMKELSSEIVTIDSELNSGSPAMIYRWIEKYLQLLSQPKRFKIEVEMEEYGGEPMSGPFGTFMFGTKNRPKLTNGKIKITKRL